MITYPELLNNKKICKDIIIRIYQILRDKIRKCMNNYWRNNLLVNNFIDKVYESIEIDESEIIGNNETILWIFGMIDKFNKVVRIYCALSDRTKNN